MFTKNKRIKEVNYLLYKRILLPYMFTSVIQSSSWKIPSVLRIADAAACQILRLGPTDGNGAPISWNDSLVVLLQTQFLAIASHEGGIVHIALLILKRWKIHLRKLLDCLHFLFVDGRFGRAYYFFQGSFGLFYKVSHLSVFFVSRSLFRFGWL